MLEGVWVLQSYHYSKLHTLPILRHTTVVASNTAGYVFSIVVAKRWTCLHHFVIVAHGMLLPQLRVHFVGCGYILFIDIH